jgi:hypothetical protein
MDHLDTDLMPAVGMGGGWDADPDNPVRVMMSPGLRARMEAEERQEARKAEAERAERIARHEAAREQWTAQQAIEVSSEQGVSVHAVMSNPERYLAGRTRALAQARSDFEDRRMEAARRAVVRRALADAGLLDVSATEPGEIFVEEGARQAVAADRDVNPAVAARGIRAKWLRRQGVNWSER